MSTGIYTLVFLLAGGGLAIPGKAGVIVPVPNFSFESPNTGTGLPTGWSGPDAGVNNFSQGGSAFGAAADGVQFLYLNLTDFGGPNPSYAESNAGLIGLAQAGTYTLTVAAGDRLNGATTNGSYIIELLAGGNVVGSDTVTDPFDTYGVDSGSWHDMTAVATVSGAAVGADLQIELIAINGTGGLQSQGQFDNVRLDLAPAPTPEPATCWMLLGGLCWIRFGARRRSNGNAVSNSGCES